MSMTKSSDRTVEAAHVRLDYLERDFRVMNEHLATFIENQEKEMRQQMRTRWMIAGGIAFYILETIGLVEAVKLAI